MPQTVPMKIIAHIHTDFPSKFGIPRQSGLVEDLKAKIVFEPEYRQPEALRGLEGFSHLWLLWQFSKADRETWSPTVRPPRLGGNARVGVFATRSPYRPNAVGLSCVRLEKIDWADVQGPVLYVAGADLLDQSPIFDIKPYLAYTDAHPEATQGFAVPFEERRLRVSVPDGLLDGMDATRQRALLAILEQDPRPAYQKDPERVYKMEFAEFEIHFTVREDQLTVCHVTGRRGPT